MAFTLLPVAIGGTMTASQYNEARDAVEERSHLAGDIAAFLTASPGDVLTSSAPFAFINSLRSRIQSLVTSVIGLKYINPATDSEWANLAEFFTAAGIGDGTNWTDVPARKGGLTVKSTLAAGDVIFAEHINEIRLAVLKLNRVRWEVGPTGTLARRRGFGGATGSSQAVWDATRLQAIAAANIATPSVNGVVAGFEGVGSVLSFPTRLRATVDLLRTHPVSITPFVGSSAPSPITFANARMETVFGSIFFVNAPPPSSSQLVEARIVAPLSALVFPPTSASWNQGIQWATFNLSAGTKIAAGLDATKLPDFNPDRDFAIVLGLTDESGDRTAWPNPFVTTPSLSQQLFLTQTKFVVDADVTNFVFQ